MEAKRVSPSQPSLSGKVHAAERIGNPHGTIMRVADNPPPRCNAKKAIEQMTAALDVAGANVRRAIHGG